VTSSTRTVTHVLHTLLSAPPVHYKRQRVFYEKTFTIIYQAATSSQPWRKASNSLLNAGTDPNVKLAINSFPLTRLFPDNSSNFGEFPTFSWQPLNSRTIPGFSSQVVTLSTLHKAAMTMVFTAAAAREATVNNNTCCYHHNNNSNNNNKRRTIIFSPSKESSPSIISSSSEQMLRMFTNISVTAAQSKHDVSANLQLCVRRDVTVLILQTDLVLRACMYCNRDRTATVYRHYAVLH